MVVRSLRGKAGDLKGSGEGTMDLWSSRRADGSSSENKPVERQKAEYGGLMSARLVAPLLLFSALVLPSCQNEDPCRTICVRVARCRLEARQGDPIPGEKEPAPDARCMKRCKTKAKNFDICEAKQRTCRELKRCLGPLR
jgi:Cys-rich protein (TIGR04453 family)